MKKTSIVVLFAVAATCLGGFAWVRAGDLNPPAGAIEPTLRTLQEIYNRIGELNGQDGCACGPWQSLVTPNVGTTTTSLLSGNGFVHAVIVKEGRGIEFLSNGDSTIIADLSTPAGSPTSQFVLNIRYENGLSFRAINGANGSDRCTVLYRADAP